MTNTENDTSPKFSAKTFVCPHCHKGAEQRWISEKIILDTFLSHQKAAFLDYRENMTDYAQIHTRKFLDYFSTKMKQLDFTEYYHTVRCVLCNKTSIWVDKKMVYPLVPSAPAPTDDMPPSVKKVYEEARLVEPYSKRAAMVLLRVCLEKLMAHLQMKGKTLNEKIKNLAKKGVTDEAIRWLLAVKVMGNEAAHIGNIDPNDKEIVKNLNKVFTTINLIVTVTITLKNMADDLTKKRPKDDNQTTNKKNP